MTFGHDDIRERLVEYLYEELDGPARAAFDAHLARCATCRAEIEAAGRARAVARTVVRAPLGEAVPLGLRARVLEAATTAARERGRAGADAAPGVTQALPTGGSRPAVGEGAAPGRGRDARQEGGGWLDWLRGRWTLPTFATVGALAVFLLVRGTIFREARRPLDETAAERLAAPTVAPSPTPVPAAAPALKAKSDGLRDRVLDRDLVEERLEPLAKPARGGGRAPAEDNRQAVEAKKDLAPAAQAKESKRPAKSDANRGPRPAAPGRPAGAVARKVRGAGDEALGALVADPSDAPKPAPPPAAASGSASGSPGRRRAAGGRAALDVEGTGGPYPSAGAAAAPAFSSPDDNARFAQPPPARVAPASPMPSASRASPAPAQSKGPASEPPRPAPIQAASAPQAADSEDEPPAAEMKRKRSADKSETAEPLPERAAASARSVDPALALSDRAAKLLAARRFTEASAAYRDLLRRFPGHPSAPLWRARLAAATQAASSNAK